MSLISKLTTLGAAGSGGAAGWIVDFDDTTHTGNFLIRTVNAGPANGNIYFSGAVKGGDRFVFGAVDEDGTMQFSRYAESATSPSASASIQGRSIAWDSSNTNAYVGMYWYEPNVSSQANGAVIKLSNVGVPASAKRLYNANNRGGTTWISMDSSNNIYACYNAYTGSRVRGYIDKLNTSLNTTRRDYVEDFQQSYLRDGRHYGSAVYLSYTHAIDASNGRYGHGIYSKGDSDQSIGIKRVFDNTSSTDNIGSGEHGVIAFDSSNLYCGGYFDEPTGASGYNSGHVFSLNRSNGNVNWQKLFIEKSGSTYYQSEVQGVCCDDSGNVYATFNGKNSHHNIAKYNSSGTLEWIYKIGTASSSRKFRCRGLIFYNGHIYTNADYTHPTDADQRGAIVKIPTDGLSTGTYGDFVVSVPTYETPTNVPSSSNVTPESSDESNMGETAWSTANGAVSITANKQDL